MCAREREGRWRARGFRVRLGVVVAVVLASAVSAVSFPLKTAGAFEPENSDWRSVQVVKNDTPYELRLLDSTKTEMTEWREAPPKVVPPRGTTGSIVRNTPAAFGHGVAQIITYGLFLNGQFQGMTVISSGVDCNTRQIQVCADYHRWQQITTSETNQPYVVWARQENNNGKPTDWRTVFVLDIRERRSAGKGRPQPPLPKADTEGATAASEAKQPTLKGSAWGVTQTVTNDSPFVLRKVMSWNSQGTQYLRDIPQEIAPRARTQWLYQNSESFHGPNSFAMYNAFDPSKKTDNYVGSAVIEAATDCDLQIKVPDIPSTCAVWRTASFSIADAVPGYELAAHSDTGGLAPWSTAADTGIRGVVTPPPTTTTEAPPFNARIVCTHSASGTEGTAFEVGQHLCTSEGRPVPDISIDEGKLPRGVKLERWPTGSDSWLSLVGTPTESGRFRIRIRASTPGYDTEDWTDIDIVATSPPTTTVAPREGKFSFEENDAIGDTIGGITAGPDSAVWFTNTRENTIGRITGVRGLVKQFAGDGISGPGSIIEFDGALWFTNYGNDSIGRITTGGEVTNYRGDGIRQPRGIAAGSDGSLWFTNRGNNSIGRINPNTGQVTNYHEDGQPDRPKIANPEGIVSGPDGALWFTNSYGHPSIGRITTDGKLSVYSSDELGFPSAITVGSDGALWASNSQTNSIDRVTTDGVITTFRGEGIDKPGGITGGSDGALWFTNSASKTIGRITTAGVVTTFGADQIRRQPGVIANGPRLQRPLWFSIGGGEHVLGRLASIFESAGPPPTAPDRTPERTPETTAATSTPPDTAPPAATRCDISLTNRAGEPVRLTNPSKSAGDVWEPAPTDEIPNDATLRWASSDAPPGACRNDTEVALRRDGPDVTWHVALTLGPDQPELACSTSDDDYPCTIVRTQTDDDRQVSVTLTLRHRTP